MTITIAPTACTYICSVQNFSDPMVFADVTHQVEKQSNFDETFF